ncbi:MAG: DEAD/DEAH box helicase, partial [Thermodesulfovibrionales bacterium]
LPPKIETEIFLELTPVQKGIYERTVKEVRTEIDEAYKTMRPERAKIVALTALLKLRQICLCPRLLSKDLPEEAPKIEVLLDQLEELLDEGHSALVFSQFTSFLDIVERHIRKAGIPFERLDGSTPVQMRKEIVKQFQESASARVFLLSLKAGGQGLNLTRASYVFHLDPWWNPAVEAQATDRTHRIGQIRTVTVTRLLMRHTIEEKMKLLKARKQALYNAILNAKTSAKGVQLTRDDLDFLLG